MWRGGLGGAYRLPALSSAGASLASPCFRFHTPLIEPDVRICRIRLSEKTHAIAVVAIACDAVCNSWKQRGSCQAHRQSPVPSSLLASAFNWSGRTVARIGLRMMPPFPQSPLSTVRWVFPSTAGRLAFQVAPSLMSRRLSLHQAYPAHHVGLRLPFVHSMASSGAPLCVGTMHSAMHRHSRS